MSSAFSNSFTPHSYGKIPMPPGMEADKKSLYGHVTNTNNQVGRISGTSFGDTVTSMIGKANDMMGKPEALSIKAIETGKVDIHEVMIALGKSEVAFKLISSLTQKMVGAFDKLTSMQV